MSDRYPGGLITKTPVTPTGPYAEGSASGVWTLDQAMQYTKQGIWPQASNPTPNDPYFQYVTSLLHGDGTNGGQNNTFLDSSTNAFTITRNGNTTQGSFSPYGSNWGNYFNGSSSYLAASTTNLTLGTGDFTAECWFYRTVANDSGSAQCIFADGSDASGLVVSMYQNKMYCYFVGVGGVFNSVSPTIADNTWYHFAWTRSGSTMYAFLNGTLLGTVSNSSDHSSTGGFAVGDTSASGTNMNNWQGYISNVRLVKGTALYTSSFTPITTPLTAVSGTQMLTAQANRFVDSSANAYTFTLTGTPQVTRFSPFAPTYATQYSASTIGGSGYFDGSGDYLSFTGSSIGASDDLRMDFWVYPNASISSGNYGLFASSDSRFGMITVSGVLYMLLSSDLNTGVNLPLYQWSNVVITRTSGTLRVFLNGTEIGSTSNSQAVNGNWRIASDQNNEIFPSCYMSDVRLLIGTGGTSVTVPTSPLTAITNTNFLCNMTNGAIYDNAETLDWETVGNAQISTSVKKYGTGSLAFDGSGDRLVSQTSNQLVNFGTSNFTIEAWIYPTTLNFYHAIINNDAGTSSGTRGFSLSVNSSGAISFFYSTNGSAEASIDSPNNVITTNNWYHIAVSKVGTATKIFLNGTQVASGTISNINFASAYPTMIGDNPQNTVPFYGYIDDLRVTKGYARYWENFTPPSAALPNFSNPSYVPPQDAQFNYTTLLLPGNGTNGAQNNTFLDSSTNAFTITRNGNTTQGTFTPFSQTGWSNNFTGSNYLNTASNSAFGTGTGNFTLEAWVFTTSFNSSFNENNIVGTGVSNGWLLGFTSTTVYLASNQNGLTVDKSFVMPLNQWTHVAAVRSGNTAYIYINGTLIGSGSYSTNNPTGACYIGSDGLNGTSRTFRGYISNVRVSNTVRYSSNFTPSSTPFTNDASTVLLSAQSNRFIDNSTNAFALTATGSPSVQAFSPFAPTAAYSASTVGGSGYFDGTGDYLTVANNTALDMGTGDFTLEFWLYSLTASQDTQWRRFVCTGQNSSAAIQVGHLGSSNGTVSYTADDSSLTVTGTTNVLNQWAHIAVVRQSGTVKLYVNGTSEGTPITDNNSKSSTDFTIGHYPSLNGYTNGYISNLRLVKGTAVYTSNFTPPTAPTTAISGTSLLTNYTNAAITDATAKNDLETVGNAQISTTQSKFGGSSMYFDGTGDYLLTVNNGKYTFGASDFTIEGWIYPTSLGSGYQSIAGVWDASGGYQWIVQINNTDTRIVWYDTGFHDESTGYDLTANTWTHIAWVRYNNKVSTFINGNLVHTTGTLGTFANNNASLNVARNGDNSEYYTGYINDFRITKGYARYVQPFTPPAQADQLY